MELAEVFEIVRPSIVALGSKRGLVIEGVPPAFPRILGTGFFVDERGIVLTNRHVAQALQELQPHPRTGESSAVAFVFSEVKADVGSRVMRVFPVDVKTYNSLNTFDPKGRFYGERLPDIAFLQLNVKDVPAICLAAEPNTLRIGMPVATAGFPLGTDALLLDQKLVQLTPLLRSGIISSLYPFPCPNPHGFTLDIMVQGGASGSPIFLTNEPRVVGLLYAGYSNVIQIGERHIPIDRNITIALPSMLLEQALSHSRKDIEALDLSDVPRLRELAEMEGRENPTWEML